MNWKPQKEAKADFLIKINKIEKSLARFTKSEP